MAISVKSKLNFLNRVSTNNGAGFIDNYEVELRKLDNDIEKERGKAKGLSDLTKGIKLSSGTSQEQIARKVNDGLSYYHKNIEDLLQLRTRLVDLYEDTIGFITKYDGDYNESLIGPELTGIQERIESFSQDFSKVQNNIFLADIRVNTIVKGMDLKQGRRRKTIKSCRKPWYRGNTKE